MGYWEVDVREDGDYQVRLLFPAAKSAGRVTASMGGVKHEAEISKGSVEAFLKLAQVPKGLTRVEAIVETSGQPAGVHYAEIRHL